MARMIDPTPLRDALAAQPSVRLSSGETPLEPLERLGAHLGIELWAKRDDCFSLALGGNKVRQLEYYLGVGEQEGADTVLVTGALQSNFVRLTAAAARRLGWQPVVQLEDRVPKNDPFYRTSGNVLLNELMGAEVHHFAEGEDEAAADRNLDTIAGGLRARGRHPYVIHLGQDHPPIGALGYADAAIETRHQLETAGVEPDHVVVASGSGLTHSGFLVGARAMGWTVPVLGICVRRDVSQQHPRVLKRARELVTMLGIECTIDDDDVQVDDSVFPPGYGRINPEVREAVRLAAEHEALLLDPVYTGRSMAGLIHHVRSGRIAPGDRVVYLHTGGTPGVFAYQNDLRMG